MALCKRGGLVVGAWTAWAASSSCSAAAALVTSRSGSRRAHVRLFSTAAPNNLLDVMSLNNDYCALRHGQSLANVEGIISSNPEIATIKHGLSEVGKEQAQGAGSDLIDLLKNNDYNGVAILSSDFLRAKETAQVVADALTTSNKDLPPLYQSKVILETRLRERWFGNWDLQSDDNYHNVWKDDAVDPDHAVENVESVNSVMARTSECVLEWDSVFNRYLVVCVAHGDVLQILQTCFQKLDGSQHRTMQHLETATLRPLELAK